MKTSEFYKALPMIKNSSKGFDQTILNDKMFGNSNWRLWHKNLWDNSTMDSITDPNIKYIFSCLSGNPSQIMSVCNNDYYEVLFANINCLLNKNFFEKFQKEKFTDFSLNFLDSVSTEDEENGANVYINEFPNIKCMGIEETLDSVKNNNLYFKVKNLI